MRTYLKSNEAAFEELQLDMNHLCDLAQKAKASWERVKPEFWSQRFQYYQGDAAKMAEFRLMYQEAVLSFLSTYIQFELEFQLRDRPGEQINELIFQLLRKIDERKIRPQERFGSVTFALKLQVLKAVELRERLRNEKSIYFGIGRDTETRFMPFVLDAFEKLEVNLTANCAMHPYTWHAAVKHPHETLRRSEQEMRVLEPVRFPGRLMPNYPHNAKIVNLLDKACTMYLELKSYLNKDYVWPQFRANDASFDAEMVEILSRPDTDKDVNQVILKQEKNRLEFETWENQFANLYIRFRYLVEQLADQLKLAVYEAREAKAKIIGIKGKLQLHQVVSVAHPNLAIMINCLALDWKLREFAYTLQSNEELFKKSGYWSVFNKNQYPTIEAMFQEKAAHYYKWLNM